jgi:hypothetical protein
MTTGTLRVERNAAPWRDKLRRYKVVLDGKPIGKIADGGVEEFSIEPGSHTLRIKLDWAGSPTIEFEVGAGESVSWSCRPGGGAWSGLGALLTPRQYIALEARPSA